MANVLNPKVALFFLALLPQFIVAGSGLGPVPFLVLGLLFIRCWAGSSTIPPVHGDLWPSGRAARTA